MATPRCKSFPGTVDAAISVRIQQGMASGHITPSDARELYRRDSGIARHDACYKRHGVVTQQVRRQLRNDLVRLSSDVGRMMRN